MTGMRLAWIVELVDHVEDSLLKVLFDVFVKLVPIQKVFLASKKEMTCLAWTCLSVLVSEQCFYFSVNARLTDSIFLFVVFLAVFAEVHSVTVL